MVQVSGDTKAAGSANPDWTTRVSHYARSYRFEAECEQAILKWLRASKDLWRNLGTALVRIVMAEYCSHVKTRVWVLRRSVEAVYRPCMKKESLVRVAPRIGDHLQFSLPQLASARS